MKHITRTTALTVLPEGKPIFDELATKIEIEDESGGEFLIIRQENGSIRIGRDEWPELIRAIDRMMDEIRQHERPEE